MNESFTAPPCRCEKCGCPCTMRIQVAGGSWQCETCYRQGPRNSFRPGDPMLPQGEEGRGFPWPLVVFLVACVLSALGGAWWGMTR